MIPEHEKILQKNIVYLKQTVLVDDLLDILLQDELLSFDQHKEIKDIQTASNKADRLFNILRFAGPNSFPTFVNCLKQSGYIEVANRLSGMVFHY